MNHPATSTRIVAVSRLSALALAAGCALLPMPGRSAEAAAPSADTKNKPVALEAIAGSTVKRVTLTAKAAERLDIQTGAVGEQAVLRRQMVSGMVIQPLIDTPAVPNANSGGFAKFDAPAATGSALKQTVALQSGASPAAVVAPAATTGAWVLVTLSPGEWERLAKDKPARIVPLSARDKSAGEILATLADRPPQEDTKRSMLTLHYVLPSTPHGLVVSSRVRVELQLAGSEEKQKVVPYSAVYYDAKGAPWVYVNTRPLTYERQRITLERVVGKFAVLSEGPASGTPVVTTGAALLYGAEIFGK
jgi:hypothetical protein